MLFLSELVWVVGVLEHSFFLFWGECWLRSGAIHMSRGSLSLELLINNDCKELVFFF